MLQFLFAMASVHMRVKRLRDDFLLRIHRMMLVPTMLTGGPELSPSRSLLSLSGQAELDPDQGTMSIPMWRLASQVED